MHSKILKETLDLKAHKAHKVLLAQMVLLVPLLVLGLQPLLLTQMLELHL